MPDAAPAVAPHDTHPNATVTELIYNTDNRLNIRHSASRRNQPEPRYHPNGLVTLTQTPWG